MRAELPTKITSPINKNYFYRRENTLPEFPIECRPPTMPKKCLHEHCIHLHNRNPYAWSQPESSTVGGAQKKLRVTTGMTHGQRANTLVDIFHAAASFNSKNQSPFSQRRRSSPSRFCIALASGKNCVSSAPPERSWIYRSQPPECVVCSGVVKPLPIIGSCLITVASIASISCAFLLVDDREGHRRLLSIFARGKGKVKI